MKCYTQQLAFAAATAMALLYALGALMVIVFPEQILNLWAPLCYLHSADLFRPYLGVSLMSFISGIAQSFAYTYIYAWLLGTVYTKLIPSK